jgi:hypothetical protein
LTVFNKSNIRQLRSENWDKKGRHIERPFCFLDIMDLDNADVPELIEALAERLTSYEIPLLQALCIASQMLSEAYANADQFEDDLAESVH